MVVVMLPAEGDAAAEATRTANRTQGCAGLRRLQLRTRPGEDQQQGYPINRMRNAGISCVETSHYFVVDVDFWPSTELLGLMRGQLTGWTIDSPPRALVVPNFQRSGHGCRNAESTRACRDAYERGEISVPSGYEELRVCLKAKDCVVFDGEYNPHGQASTDIRRWLELPAGQTHAIPCISSERWIREIDP